MIIRVDIIFEILKDFNEKMNVFSILEKLVEKEGFNKNDFNFLIIFLIVR